MKPSTRLDSRLFSLKHYLYKDDGTPKPYVEGLDEVVAEYGDNHAYHDLDLQVAREVTTDDAGVILSASPFFEVAFITRGKIGGGTDRMLTDLGVWSSRAIQGRDPATGDEMPWEAPPRLYTQGEMDEALSALRIARNQGVAFMLDLNYGAEASVKNVAYIDALLEKKP
jgi:hypothetical protein